MTKRKYTQASRLSRLHPASPLARAPKGKLPARSQRSRPFSSEYVALFEEDRHPVDDIIAQVPEVARLDRKLRRLAQSWQSRVSDVPAFIDYEDQRLAQRVLREELFFDAGFEYGRQAGCVESRNSTRHHRAAPAARALARSVRMAAVTSKLPSHQTSAVLLDVVRALVLEPARSSR